MSQTQTTDPIYPQVGDELTEEKKELQEGEINFEFILISLLPALFCGPVVVSKLPTSCCQAHASGYIQKNPLFVATTISTLALWFSVKLARTRLTTIKAFFSEDVVLKPRDVVLSLPSLAVVAAAFNKIFI